MIKLLCSLSLTCNNQHTFADLFFPVHFVHFTVRYTVVLRSDKKTTSPHCINTFKIYIRYTMLSLSLYSVWSQSTDLDELMIMFFVVLCCKLRYLQNIKILLRMCKQLWLHSYSKSQDHFCIDYLFKWINTIYLGYCNCLTGWHDRENVLNFAYE